MLDEAHTAKETSADEFAGDPRSTHVRALYQQYKGELVRYLRRAFGAGPPEPEDVMQASFAKLAAQDDPLCIANPRAFLYRVATNLVLNERRDGKVRARFIQSPDAEKIFPSAEELNAERVLDAKEQLRIVEAVVEALPSPQREVFVLNRFHDCSYAEIARQKRLGEDQVRRWVMSAMAKCEAALHAANNKTGGAVKP